MLEPSVNSSIDWGNVPAWFGAVLTGGTFLLGFYIILRDRRSKEREQAEKIACWVEPWKRNKHSDFGEIIATVHIVNGSEQIIRDVFWYQTGGLFDTTIYSGTNEIAAGERWEHQWRFSSLCYRRSDTTLFFFDASGREWVRDLSEVT